MSLCIVNERQRNRSNSTGVLSRLLLKFSIIGKIAREKIGKEVVQINQVENSDKRMMKKLRDFSPLTKSVIICLLTIPVLSILISQYFYEFALVQYDDSFITYRYARNFAQGNGLRFNPGDSSNSASSFLFVLLLGIGHFVTRVPIEILATTVNIAALCGLVVMMTYLIFKFTKSLWGYPVALIIGLSIVTHGSLIYWTLSGMETTFFMALLAAAVLFSFSAIDHDGRQQSIPFLVILGLLAITRVEGAVCGAALGALCSLKYSKNWRSSGLLKVLIPALIPVGMFSFQLIFYKVYFGFAIADPIHFKDHVRYYSRSSGMAWSASKHVLLTSMRPFSVIAVSALLFFVVYVFRNRQHALKAVVLPMLTLLLGAFILRSPHSDEYRYELILFVPLIIGCSIAFGCLMRIQKLQIRFVGLVFILLFGMTSINNGLNEASQIESRTSTYMYVQRARAEAGKWLEKNSPPGSRVVSADIGALSYFNPSNIFVDTPGLVNRKQLQIVQEGGDVYSSMKAQSPSYLADTVGPDGISAVESILSNPLGYYNEDSKVGSSCTMLPIFNKDVLELIPKKPTSILQIQIAKIEWNSCSE